MAKKSNPVPEGTLPLGEQPQPPEAVDGTPKVKQEEVADNELDVKQPEELDTTPETDHLPAGADVAEHTVDPDSPKEGDTITHENGDIEVYTNGTWIVHVSHSEHTGQ